MTIPLDIVNLIARFDPVIQCSLHPTLKLDHTYDFLYSSLKNGFTDEFLKVLHHTVLTFEQLEDCFELAFLYRDMECIDAILAQLPMRSESVKRSLEMCLWFEKELKYKLQHYS